MITICMPIEFVFDIIGKQKIKKEAQYRETRHQIKLRCEDGILLYHTLTGELILLESSETEDACRDELIKRWFMVPEDFEERKQADGVRNVAKLMRKQKRGRTTFTILTTTDCNARCVYCYEMGTPRYSMSPETARDVGNYIARICDKKKVKISWFGGEPLLNTDAIDIICGILKDYQIDFDSSLTSNGFYLDAETARKAVSEWHIKMVQITLDGTESVYNRTKAYIDQEACNPFFRVMSNIKAALDAGIEVSIRLNMDRANAEDLFILADEIGKRFGSYPGFYGRVALLRRFIGDIHDFSSEEEAADYQQSLQEKLDSYSIGSRIKLSRSLYINQCMADNDNCEVILPDGRIERCEHIRESEVTGSIYEDARNTEKVQEWKKTVYFSECMDCELYPMCVNLAKCEWQKNGCSEARRRNARKRMSEAILAVYHNDEETKGKGNNETEAELHSGGSWW